MNRHVWCHFELFGAFVAVLVAVGVLVQPAHAQALTDEEKAELKALATEGSEAYREGRFLDAAAAFEKAEAISKDPRVQYNLARALEEAGHCSAAKSWYEQLANDKDAQKVVLEKSRDKIENGLTCTPRGNVVFACETPGATVELGGESVVCGEPVRLEVTTYSWRATAAGYVPDAGSVTPVEAETVNVVVALQPQSTVDGGSNWKLFTGIAMLGAGAGAMAVGVVSDSTSNARSERIIDAIEDGDRDRLARLQDDAQSARVTTLILYSAGAALAVGGGVLLALDLMESEEDVQVTPMVSTDGAGVQARWRW
jgi:hypothetical protein